MALGEEIVGRLSDCLDRPVRHRRPRGVDKLPDCAELCRRWEARPWSAHALDFAPDVAQWRGLDQRDQAQWTGRVIGILRGEVAATDALAVYISAVGRRDQELYVATQIADEARHTTLFERFHGIVCDPERHAGGSPDASAPWTSAAYKALVAGALPALCARLRADRRDREALVEAVTLLHVLVEGGLGMARLRAMAADLAARRLFPVLRRGLALAAQDEVRHYLFGLRFLRDAVRQDPEHGQIVVRTLAAHLPTLLEIVGRQGAAPGQEPARTLRRLGRGLSVVGIDVALAA